MQSLNAIYTTGNTVKTNKKYLAARRLDRLCLILQNGFQTDTVSVHVVIIFGQKIYYNGFKTSTKVAN